MSGIVIFAKSRPSPVWLRQRYGKARPSIAQAVILVRGYLAFPSFRGTRIVSTNPQYAGTLHCRRTLFFPSGVRQPFNAHRGSVVERFSPIHF
jgi:hypothetical protein